MVRVGMVAVVMACSAETDSVTVGADGNVQPDVVVQAELMRFETRISRLQERLVTDQVPL